MAVNGGHAGTKKGPNWGHVKVSTIRTPLGKPQTGSFVTGSFRQALATRSSSARQTFVSIVFVFAIARQTLAKRLSKTTRYDGFLWVFPRKVVRIRMNSRNSLYNAPAKKVSKYFGFFLGFDNSHTTPQKIPPDEEGLLWGWCVVGGPLNQQAAPQAAAAIARAKTLSRLSQAVSSKRQHLHTKRGAGKERERERERDVCVSAAPRQSEISVKFSVFHTVFDVKFW